MNQTESWLALHSIKGIGPKLFQTLVSAFKSPEGVFAANRLALREHGVPIASCIEIEQFKLQSIQPALDWLDRSDDHHLLTLSDPLYPKKLLEIHDPPPILFLRGQRNALALPMLAIVGSRHPTGAGTRIAFSFARELANQGFSVVSGLAQGIDSAAHQGALDAQRGGTLAVFGTGPDRIYPARNRRLAATICSEHATLSEFMPGTRPLPANFPRRNRVISGLSSGVLVIEAARESGSLITAKCALDQNREVFAIPGSLQNPLSKGCHQLIREGAKLVETLDDILEELNTQNEFLQAPQASASTSANVSGLSKELSQLWQFLEDQPCSVDFLVEKSGLTADQVSSMLAQLELAGLAVQEGYGMYSRFVLEERE